MPHLFFAASGRPVRDELRLFAEEAAASDLPGAALFAGVELSSWDAALRLLASALPDDGSVVVLDEIPYLIAADGGFEGTLQRAFDRELVRKRVLLIGIGSDLAMMEALNEYGRPFHQRATEMVVPPLSPAEVGELLDLPAAEAFDAYLVTGSLRPGRRRHPARVAESHSRAARGETHRRRRRAAVHEIRIQGQALPGGRSVPAVLVGLPRSVCRGDRAGAR